ncbi:MAG TPA: ribosome recycling factor [Candidatus Xenobia bacterium]|jgi:ribosome recycling factor
MVEQTLFRDTEERMKKAMDVLKREMSTIRTGRAAPGLLDHIKVDAYGQAMPIKQCGNINVPEPRMIVIQPWDKGLLGAIEKAIQKSDLGINPTNDGVSVRLSFPPLTEERRKEIVKMMRKRGEEGKVTLRNLRRDAIEELRKEEKAGKATEDEVKRAQDQIQKLTDKYTKEFDEVLAGKEKEILEV